MSQEPTIDRLSAYLDGELTPDEIVELEVQLGESASLRDQLEKLRRVRDWFREYPGRKPEKDLWSQIATHVSESGHAQQDAEREDDRTRRGRVPGAFFMPVFAWAGMSTFMKRLGIVALVGVALGGMGRQFVLERRAQDLKQASIIRGVQLVRYANDVKWHTNALGSRGRIGRRFSIACPPSGQLGSVWGTGIYTDDSSICTAAVHSGAITQEAGGIVSYEIQDGLPTYRGETQNGVMSRDFGNWPGSFVIVPERRPPGDMTELDGGTITWDASALDLRGLNGTIARFTCPMAGENRGPIFGTGTYTDDSSICTAAVHAGLITYQDGGDVAIQVMPGLGRYDGSSLNDVESLDFPEWSGSYRFVEGGLSQRVRARVNLNPSIAVGGDSEHRLAPKLTMQVIEIGWKTNAMELNGLNGFRGEVICPPNGTAAAVWGTEAYASESSICTAAVHAGLINFQDGGAVTFEIFPGLSNYEGAEKNGVASRFASRAIGGGFMFVPRSDAGEGG